MVRYMTLTGAVGAGVAPLLSGGAARSDAVDPTVIGLAVGVVVVAALACARARAVRVVAVCGALVLLTLCGWLAVVDVGTGVAGPRVPVLAVAAVAVAVGSTWSVSWRVTPAGVVAAVLAAGAVVVAPSAAEAAVVRSQPRDVPRFEPAAVVERPGGRQWSWQPSADVVEVVAAGHGVVVALGDGGLTALDGADGRELWRYGRRGAEVGSLVASADRATVVATFRTGRDTRRHLMVVLDAATGRVRFERLVRGVVAEIGGLVPGTRTLALRDGGDLVGFDLVTGEQLWRWTAPPGCTALYTEAVRGRSTVFAAVECPDHLSVHALDEVGGERRWEHRVPLARDGGERRDVHLRGSPDGAHVAIRVVTPDVAPDAVTSGLFDAGSGRLLTRPEPGWVVRTDLGSRPVLELEPAEAPGVREVVAVDATGARTALDHAGCPHRSADATTATSYLRACGDTGRDLTLLAQGLDGGPVDAVAVRLDGSGASSRLRLVPAPGAVVVARTAFGGSPAPVVGLTGR